MDYTYMSLGAGVQSSTLAEMIAERELPPPDLVIFADTGDEPAHTYQQVDYLRQRLGGVGVELVTVSAGNLRQALQSGVGRFAAIPAFTVKDGKRGRLQRQCTADYKIAPIEAVVRARLLEMGLAKRRKGDGAILIKRGVQAEAWLGISLDEVQRMKPNRTRWINNRWPLIEKRMTRHDCRQWLLTRNLPMPQKSSCLICPFHDDRAWRHLRNNAPDDWAGVVDFDASLRDERAGRFSSTATGQLFLHSSCVPLDEVDLRTPQERGQLSLFETETDVCDEGYCFI